MHDSRFPCILRDVLLPVLIGLALLAAIPFLFPGPVTVFGGPLDMAIHGYQLSAAGRIWDGEPALPPGPPQPPAGRLAIGTHQLYPLRFHTARDTVSGEVLVRIISPEAVRVFPEETGWNGYRVRFARYSGTLYVLFGEQGTPSWPGEVFSIITNR